MYVRRVCNSDDVVALGETDTVFPCRTCTRSEHRLDVAQSVIDIGRSPLSFSLVRLQVFRPRAPIHFNLSRHGDLTEVGGSMDGPMCRILPSSDGPTSPIWVTRSGMLEPGSTVPVTWPCSGNRYSWRTF